MKLSILSTTLSIALSGGLAAAQSQQYEPTQPPPTEAPPAAQTAPAEQPAQPAQPAQIEQPTTTVEAVQPVDLLFDTSSAQLTGDARAQLYQLAQWAKCNPTGAVILEGHADPRGSQRYNLTLSGERAAAVRQKLIRMGVPSERIVISVYGENGPRRATYREDRRVTVRATTAPIMPQALTASR